MKILKKLKTGNQRGRFGLDILLWLFGVPLPFIILFSLIRGCR
jgi:hypothetical protein